MRGRRGVYLSHCVHCVVHVADVASAPPPSASSHLLVSFSRPDRTGLCDRCAISIAATPTLDAACWLFCPRRWGWWPFPFRGVSRVLGQVPGHQLDKPSQSAPS
ncbi:hypothetical protein GQ53DRAFT_315639 [Thozetella sp. PMI_491]|nr:hypothetical protein GQ53DRAFT_315639 [Thozetella sp. PMI_491]